MNGAELSSLMVSSVSQKYPPSDVSYFEKLIRDGPLLSEDMPRLFVDQLRPASLLKVIIKQS